MKKKDQMTEVIIARISADLKLQILKAAKRRNVRESEFLRLAIISFLSQK